VEKLLSDHEAQFISWRMYRPLVVKLLLLITTFEERDRNLQHMRERSPWGPPRAGRVSFSSFHTELIM